MAWRGVQFQFPSSSFILEVAETSSQILVQLAEFSHKRRFSFSWILEFLRPVVVVISKDIIRALIKTTSVYLKSQNAVHHLSYNFYLHKTIEKISQPMLDKGVGYLLPIHTRSSLYRLYINIKPHHMLKTQSNVILLLVR